MEFKAVLRSVGEDPDDEDIREIFLEIDQDSKLIQRKQESLLRKKSCRL